MVVPLLYGSGIKTKVLSALSCGLPVLSNSIGIEGINVNSNSEYIHCENTNDFVEGIIRLYNNKDLYLKICKKSRDYMKYSYDMNKCAYQYQDILETALEYKKPL